jgi:site-specific recombinase XerD
MLREHPRRRSLDQVVDAFLADCRARNLSPRTLEHYDSAIRSFRATLGAPPAAHVLADLEPGATRAWIAVLQRTRRPVSVQSAVRGLKVLGHWVAREGYAGADPLATVRLPKAPPPLIVPLSGDQVAALMAAGSPVLRVAVALLADTGIRASELCGLAVDDVREGFLRILAKGGRERLVPYGAAAAGELTRYVTRGRPAPLRHPDEPLLLLASGVPLTAHRLGELMRGTGRQLRLRGVRCSPHTLRHTFAIEFLRNGGGELALQKALGHRSLEMVRVYAEITEIDLLEIHAGASPLDRWRRDGTVGPSHRRGGSPAAARRASSLSSGERRA